MVWVHLVILSRRLNAIPTATRLTAIGLLLCLLPTWLQAQTGDTLRREHLQEVEIQGQRTPSTLRVATPTQVVTIEKIQNTGALQVSDALKQLAGVTLKDYGGIGGMKTVSARGLGSQFSTLSIDGITVSDARNGQIDMGRYTLGNSAYVSFANGQNDDPLQSAHSYAAGNVVSIATQQPWFASGEHTHLSGKMDVGSFCLSAFTLLWQERLSGKTTISLWGNHTRSDGDYPFTLYYTRSHNDSTSRERRQNTQMRTTTIDANLFHQFAKRRQLHIKAHYINGYHALPGAVILYNTVKSSEHTEEQMILVQARYRAEWERLQMQLLAKYQYNDDLYEDTAVSSPVYNTYYQNYAYMSATVGYKLLPSLQISWANDVSGEWLNSNLVLNNRMQRDNLLSTIALHFERRRVTADAHLLATLIHEDNSRSNSTFSTLQVDNPAYYRRVSPYLGATLQPLGAIPLRLRYFVKETYRVPNFSELYFLSTPRSLEPECALQHNVGLTWSHYGGERWQCRLTADGYYNRVSNKIVAMPRQNMFVWSMYNLGKVEITGAEVCVDGEVRLGADCDDDWRLQLSASYSYQKAVDRTDPDITTVAGKTYGHQIPYTPRHSAVGSAYITTAWVNLGYTVTWVGERYSTGQNKPENRMEPYCDQGVSVDRSIRLRHGEMKLRLMLNNIFDTQYEIVRSYPMMGRNWRLTLQYAF